MKKENRAILEMLAAANSSEDIENVCAAIDRAFQSEKITWKDHELFYSLVRKISDLMGI